jgi:methionyl-tRNA synthetase
MSKHFYITTTLPYVNAEPHIGFAMEAIRADSVARIRALAGDDVLLNTGTDEHGLKIYRKAKEQHVDTQEYVDGLSQRYRELLAALGITEMPHRTIHFIRTTDEKHKKAAVEFWNRVNANGYIYKKTYTIKYCVGCELEKTESELVEGKCPLHPLQDPELINEENYFFKFSAFQQKLLDLYTSNPTFVIPDFRFNEIKAFVARGLEDFSISRLATKMPWGIPVPGDLSQVMYVWFDALIDYISTLGWPDDIDSFETWWNKTGGVVQYCGKDNLRQQSAMWQAMLMAAGITPSKAVVVNGFITGDGGLKMSKSLGNTVDPFEIVAAYGTDALRYYVLREIHPFEDSPFTLDKFKDAYNAHLANGIGNLTSRILKMATTYGISLSSEEKNIRYYTPEVADSITASFDLSKKMGEIWQQIALLDEHIQKTEPFKKIKVDPDAAKKDVHDMLANLYSISYMLEPFLPETASTIQNLIRENNMPEKPLFMRK